MTSTLKLGSKIPISEIEGDISEASGMTGFLDDDLTKLTQAGLNKISDKFTPDFGKKIVINYNQGTTTGTFEENGWFCINLAALYSVQGASYNMLAKVNGLSICIATIGNITENNSAVVRVRKGDTYLIECPIKDSNQWSAFYFIPDKIAEEAA